MTSSNMPLKVLVIAYACEPHEGSEPGTGWNFAKELAGSCNVTVITRANNEAPIAHELSKNPIPNLHFKYIDPPNFLVRLKRAGLLPTQMFYFFWQLTVAIAYWGKMTNKCYDIVHQLTFNSFEVPPLLFLAKADAKLVWGPIGGGQTVPMRHLPLFGLRAAALECARNIRVKLSALNPLCIKALRNASLVYFANDETRRLLSLWSPDHTKMMIDVGVNTKIFESKPVDKGGNPAAVILFAGRLEGRKGAMLLLKSISRLSQKGQPLECRIVGTGPQQKIIHELILQYGLSEQVKMLGGISHDEMARELASADMFVFPSLRDTSGAVVLEAMATCLPTICINHQGGGIMIDDKCGIKIEPSGIEEMVECLADSIQQLASRPDLRRSMGDHARKKVVQDYGWGARVNKVKGDYLQILK